MIPRWKRGRCFRSGVCRWGPIYTSVAHAGAFTTETQRITEIHREDREQRETTLPFVVPPLGGVFLGKSKTPA
jgi:hypothetical protein